MKRLEIVFLVVIGLMTFSCGPSQEELDKLDEDERLRNEKIEEKQRVEACRKDSLSYYTNFSDSLISIKK